MKPASFQGEFCSTIPYLRGYYDRDFLYKLWTLLESEPDAWPRIFWNNPHAETDVPKWGDLVDWVAFVESPMEPRSWLICQANRTGEICGLIWFDKQTEKTAYGNIWIARKYRGGSYSRDCVKLGCEYAFYARGWETLFTITPWPIARNLVRRCGWTALPNVEQLFSVMGEPTTIYASKQTREGYEQWVKAADHHASHNHRQTSSKRTS